MPEGTERWAKERQGQNWPGKNVLSNFPMKIKVAPFVFTNHSQSMKINLFLQHGVPSVRQKYKNKRSRKATQQCSEIRN